LVFLVRASFCNGGIFAAFSESVADLTAGVAVAAQKDGALVSYDSICRPLLWKSIGGQEKCRKVNRLARR